MSFLTKIGQTIAKVVQVATGFLPLVQGVTQGTNAASTVNEVSDDLTKIAGMVTTVEAVFAAVSDPTAKTGAQKLQAATPLVAQVIQQSEILAGKKITNEALFTQACKEIAGGMADLLNAIDTK